MSEIYDGEAVLARLRSQAAREMYRITLHAHQEMVEENVTLDEVRSVLLDARLLENYPEHKRGACCLICGRSTRERFLHVVCTTSLEYAIIITVYEPKQPKWITPFDRGAKS